MGLRLPALLLPLFICCSILSQAQVRLFAGPQMTTANYSVRNARQETDWKGGFFAGIGLTNQVEGPVYFAPSLYFNRKGYKVSFNRPSVPPGASAKDNNTSINTIAFSPLLQFNLSKQSSHLFVRLGPAIEVAISGKETFNDGSNARTNRAMLFDPTGYSRATAFANFHVGFEQQNGLGFYVHYEHGLSSLNNADLGPIILHRVLGVGVQWMLRKK